MNRLKFVSKYLRLRKRHTSGSINFKIRLSVTIVREEIYYISKLSGMKIKIERWKERS